MNADGVTLGPFDTLDEVRDYLTRYAGVNEWRGKVSMSLCELGRDELADEAASATRSP